MGRSQSRLPLQFASYDVFEAGFTGTTLLEDREALRPFQILTVTAVFAGDSRSGPCTVSARVPGGPFQCAVPPDGVLNQEVLASAVSGAALRAREAGFFPRGKVEYTLLLVAYEPHFFWIVATDVYWSPQSPF